MITTYYFGDGYHNALEVEFVYNERCYLSVSPIKISEGIRYTKDYKGFNITLNNEFMKRKNTKKLDKLNKA